MKTTAVIRVGTTGWSIPGPFAPLFPPAGSHLERYSKRFNAVEINTSFYKLHKPETYTRWAQSVPEDFKFSVKMPKQITHEGQLGDLSILTEFLAAVQALGNRIGPLLVQLPPGLAFEAHRVERFFITLRKNFDGQIACEPRGRGWFGQQAEELLDGLEVARVAADPPVAIGAEQPGGWKGLCYFRLHGSPRRYHSVYRPEVLEKILDNLRRLSRSAEVWCIFDNTASGAATGNALEILEKLS